MRIVLIQVILKVAPIIILLSISPIFSQDEMTIRGKVRDLNTHHEISYASIQIKDTQIGTISDFAGRYYLKIVNPDSQMVVIFKHIGYDVYEVPLVIVGRQENIYLQPRVIPLPELQVEATGNRVIEIEKDLPQTVSILEAQHFEIRGYVDAGDLLKTDHSVQVNEDLSGKKTVSIRSGNPDEVIVLYNGVKMNSLLDNVFDLALIDLENVERFEVIKGSHTSLYGPEAFSGVINIVPKIEQDYSVRFQQRVGTYNSGNWGMQLFHNLNRLYGLYSIKKGGSDRILSSGDLLENNSSHHSASIVYKLSDKKNHTVKNTLRTMYINTSLDYYNQRDNEGLNNSNQMISLSFDGDIKKFKDWSISISQRWLDESQVLTSNSGSLDRDFKDNGFLLNLNKSFSFSKGKILFGYQYENSDLDYRSEREFINEEPLGLESANLERNHHGLISILKLRTPSSSGIFLLADFDISIRYDRVNDRQNDPVLRDEIYFSQLQNLTLFGENNWEEVTVKFSTHLSGHKDKLTFNGYFNFGSNVKFPTLFQQISLPSLPTPIIFNGGSPNLNPEKNQSLEIGLDFTGDTRELENIYGWHVSANFIQNYYENKFRSFYTPGIPVAFYDNIPIARISGIENKSSIFLFRKKVTVEYGYSRYFVNEKAAFPFKHDRKHIANLFVDHYGYSFQLHFFKEGEMEGWLRQSNSLIFNRIKLPGQTNFDLHLSKSFDMKKMKIFANISGRNLLDDKTELDGIAIRDRRFYITLGGQY